MISNAGENIHRLAPVGSGVQHAIRREQGEMELGRQFDERLVDSFFTSNVMALDFDEHMVFTKSAREPFQPL